MTKEQAKTDKSSIGSRIREGLKGLLDRLREEVEGIAGALNPQQEPALQPVPVRVPDGRRYRR